MQYNSLLKIKFRLLLINKQNTNWENQMIRYEVKTPHKAFVGCEDNITDAKAYINSLIENGVEILKVEYFDRDDRIAAIRNGEV
tara:strand:- start:1355 stop:1606 length:252 start_codon:yes stop_codon:yes gene_type:complete